MIESHFGLKSRPFGSKAEGAAVFTGPQQAKITKSLHKALSVPDAIVTLTGPVGVGKTTIVGKALESITPNRMAAWIGRMQLAPDEVLELLLAGFGVRTKTSGTIRRFAVFRRLLAERAAAGAPVTIVVEDAQRIGAETLMELEALTAADAGDATAANIILMGTDLNALLSQPDLARLKQRSRLRQKVAPFGQAEVTAYLKHAIRYAGSEYDSIFGPGVDEIVFGCSEGIPRMINTLCAAALEAAMEEGKKLVSAALVHQVAEETFGYEGPLPDVQSPQPESAPPVDQQADSATDGAAQANPAKTEDAEIDWEAPPVAKNTNDAPAENDPSEINEEDLPPAARNIVVESGHYPALPEVPEDSPLAESPEAEDKPAAEPVEAVAAESADFDIPELIEDTQPELSTLPVAEPPVTEDAPVEDTGTVTIEKPQGIEEAAAASAGNPVNAGAAVPTKDGDGKFDLDAALSIETEDTNIMQGITPNLDNVVNEGKAAGAANPGNNTDVSNGDASPSLGNLPTLSDSMRVDIDKEVARAGKVEPQATAIPEPAPPASPEPETKSVDSPTPMPKPAIEEAPESESAAESAAPPSVEMVLEPEPELVAQLPTAMEPEPEPESQPAEQPGPQESEMTARIAALDPANRTSDVDALEAALDAAKKGNLDDLMAPPPMPSVSNTAATESEDEPPVAIPEITLDDKLAKKQKPSAISLEAAAEISKANSLEEFSDTMAETLFGNEDLDAIAAEVIVNPPSEGYVAGEEPPESQPVHAEEPGQADAADDPLALKLEDTANSMPVPPAPDGHLRESQAMRAGILKSLQDTNGSTPAEHIEMAHEPATAIPSPPKAHQPEPIENQINTSMTQTLEALNVAKVADSLAEEADEKPAKKSGGLFSRFRKSS